MRARLLPALLLIAGAIALPSTTLAGTADIIIVVDTSGSMAPEIADLQASLNAMANSLAAGPVDAHFVLIGDGICVPPPLGSGNCPADESLPGFRHIQVSVGSNAPLQEILDTYPQWQGSLRPGAARVIIVVSDDDSSLGAANFESQLLALDASFAGYQFHAYVAASVCLPFADTVGEIYLELVVITGGVAGDLCSQFILPFIDQSAAATVELADTFRRGDANRDGMFDIADPIQVLGFLFGAESLDCPVAADSNDDEALDIADAIHSLTALFGGGPSPPAPYPSCGSDPTPGPLGCGTPSTCP